MQNAASLVGPFPRDRKGCGIELRERTKRIDVGPTGSAVTNKNPYKPKTEREEENERTRSFTVRTSGFVWNNHFVSSEGKATKRAAR